MTSHKCFPYWHRFHRACMGLIEDEFDAHMARCNSARGLLIVITSEGFATLEDVPSQELQVKFNNAHEPIVAGFIDLDDAKRFATAPNARVLLFLRAEAQGVAENIDQTQRRDIAQKTKWVNQTHLSRASEILSSTTSGTCHTRRNT